MSADKKRMGRGLDAMLGPKPGGSASTPPVQVVKETGHARIEDVHPNRAQPRQRFDDSKLDELAQSIRENGILEPIVVRKRAPGGYEIIAGERRWRAAQKAGLHEVPIFVRELTTQAAFEAAIVENLQREDLNAIETARAFARLMEEHKHTQETIALKIGKDRSTIANALRLLKLPASVIERIENGELTEGHGRALLMAPSAAVMSKLAEQAVQREWSVRETERQARAAANPPAKPEPKSANVKDLENRLSKTLGARVNISDNQGKGHISIAYTSLDELDRLLGKMMN